MTLFGCFVGLFLLLMVLGGVIVTSFIPFVCWAFAIVFWISLSILVGGLVFGLISAAVHGDEERLKTTVGAAFSIFLCGIAICVILVVAAYIVDFVRVLMSLFGMNEQTGINWERMFFPWK